MRHLPRILTLTALGLVFAGRPGAAHAQTQQELTAEGMAAYRAKDFPRAAARLQEAVAKGAADIDSLYNAACATALAGDRDTAFRLLERTIEAGFRNAALLQADTDLVSLHSDARWAKIVAGAEARQAAWAKEHGDPARARFVTSDIGRFWTAWDAAMNATPEARPAIFEREYIAPGTPGLRDWMASGRLTAEALTRTVTARPAFFAAIRPFTLRVDAHLARAREAFVRLKALYPDAIFPDVTFVMGQINSGGTTSDNGLLMGAEMFSRDPAVPLAELTDWQKGAIMAPDEIAPLVTHEAVHFLQKYPDNGPLLCAALKEGTADFVGELASGALIRRMQATHTWANARERELWLEFREAMNGRNTARWLYGDSGGDGRPVDLGYWMGYKIGEAHYRHAKDKTRALREMLVVSDCAGLLAASRYEEKFAAAAKP